MKQPMVSIIIPVYNGSNFVSKAIDSALGQTYPNCEVIVVNDGSCDSNRTDEICKSYGTMIRYFSKPNGGVSSALNYGIQQMHGDYFCWLSHDDYYGPQKVSHQMTVLETLPKDTILYSDYYMVYQELHLKVRVNFKKKYQNDLLDEPLFPVFHGLVSGCTVLFHKNHFERVGMFDETLLTTQDYELWFRIFQGQRVHYCSHTDVYMREHKSQSSRTIPEHRSNENALWESLVECVPTADMCRMSGTPYLFYQEMATVYCRFGLFEAEARCKELATEEINHRGMPQRSAEQMLFDIVCDQYEKQTSSSRHSSKTHLLTWSNIIYVLYEMRTNGIKATLRLLK